MHIMLKLLSLQRCWLFVLLLLFPWGAMIARTWTVGELPVPYLQDRTQYVSNPDSVLKPSTVRALNVLLYKLEQDKGVQSLIVVVDRVAGGDPYEFGMALGRKYGVGSKEKRTGLIVVLAKGDRAYHFLTGNGLEATLPDALIQRIEDKIFVTKLKQEDWDGAMLAALQAIDRICRGDESLTKSLEEESGSVLEIFLGFLVFLLFAGYPIYFVVSFFWRMIRPIVSYCKKRIPRRCPHCKQRSCRREKEFEENEYQNGERYIVSFAMYVCSKCGHTIRERDGRRSAYTRRDSSSNEGSSARSRARSSNHNSSRSYGSSSSSGGSYGGGSFGGGGSGGRF